MLALQLAFLWSFLLLIAYLIVSKTAPVRWQTVSPWVVLLVALVVRLVPNALLENGAAFDIQSYELVATVTQIGNDVYSDPDTYNRHPYLPLQMYWLAAADSLSQQTGITYAKIVRLLPIAADLGITLLVVAFLRRTMSEKGEALRGGLLYALNPIAVFVCAYHGQFDAEPLLFMLLALWTLQNTPRGAVQAGLWLGLGILTKSWPALALPALLPTLSSWRNRILLVAATGFVPLIGIAVYSVWTHANPFEFTGRALGYNAGVGIYGYTYFARLVREIGPLNPAPLQWVAAYGKFITLGLLAVIWWFRARHETAVAATLTIFVAFFAVTHAFAIQYLCWLVPLALLNRENRWLVAYTVVAYAYMCLVYSTFIFTQSIVNVMPLPQADYLLIMPASLPIWIVCMAWLWGKIKKRTVVGMDQSAFEGTRITQR